MVCGYPKCQKNEGKGAAERRREKKGGVSIEKKDVFNRAAFMSIFSTNWVPAAPLHLDAQLHSATKRCQHTVDVSTSRSFHVSLHASHYSSAVSGCVFATSYHNRDHWFSLGERSFVNGGQFSQSSSLWRREVWKYGILSQSGPSEQRVQRRHPVATRTCLARAPCQASARRGTLLVFGCSSRVIKK